MIVEEKIEIIINKSNKSIYGKDKNIGDVVFIDVDKLTKGSNLTINVKCDYCGDITSMTYKRHIEATKILNKHSCFNCKSLKSNEVSLLKYGVENVMFINNFKEKQKNKIKELYGVENVFELEEIKEKSKSTLIEKFGVDNYTKTDEYKEKSKKHNLEKYGRYHMFQSQEFRKKNYKIDSHPNFIEYVDKSISIFKCDCLMEHTFKIDINNFHNRFKNNSLPICTVCYPISEQRSIKEKELLNYIRSIYSGEITESYRDGLEIDIYLPELKVGFEFNGLYWHSNQFKDKNYHLNKTNHFKEKGIRIIHIWEDDWSNKKDIIKSQISNLMGKSIKIFARKCKVFEIDIDSCRRFLKVNHIQGDYKNINKSIGIFYNNELISVMTFDQFEGRKKMSENEWNLSRFCNKINHTVIGGASKLLDFFIKNYSPKRIISYADKSWSIGELYNKLEFKSIYETNPDYKYIEGNIRKHKSGFKKTKTGISESNLQLDKIYDCGKIKFEKLL